MKGIAACTKRSQRSFTTAIIDSGAATTVVGSVWLENYLKFTNQQATYEKHSKAFAFGRDVRMAANKAKFPIQINNQRLEITAWVMEEGPNEHNVPLLLSRTWLEQNKITINFTHPTKVTWKRQGTDEEIKTQTQNGHIAIALIKRFDYAKELLQQAKNLHRRLGHPSADRLIRHIRAVGGDEELVRQVKDVTTQCYDCKKGGGPRHKPTCSLPITEFNHTVAIDVAEYRQKKFLKIVDLFSRFGIAVAISESSSKTIINALELYWFAYFGPMKYIRFDPAPEHPDGPNCKAF